MSEKGVHLRTLLELNRTLGKVKGTNLRFMINYPWKNHKTGEANIIKMERNIKYNIRLF